MANISTVFVRVEQRPERERDLTSADLFKVLLQMNRGETYNVPLWDRTTTTSIDVQFGARWGASWAVEELWEQFGDQLSSVWVRWTGGHISWNYDCVLPDGDVLMCRTADTADPIPRRCPYWFDEIRLTPAFDPMPALPAPPGWSVTPTGWHSATRPCRRFADNNRDWFSLLVDPGVPTTTSTTDAQTNWLISEDWLSYYWPDIGLPTAITDYIAAHDSQLHRVEVCWRNKPVETSIRMGTGPDDGWTFWASDDWTTCADEEFLNHFGTSLDGAGA
ncbi:hypothetical protein OIE68_00700 [Nocardia vinacea]|uniref:hypothetical protein n=1 Tax=Nocardia vinacea TaxID=96468 RepID=UPI002E123702|nr:hypothetical protein OIE68_00700 [Nocardia vinacea]